jgi:hypothetical protein
MRRLGLWKNGVALLALSVTTNAFSPSSRRILDHSSVYRIALSKPFGKDIRCNNSQTTDFRFSKAHALELSSNNESGDIETEKKELGIWAARGILLVVAAVWGTNFAVCTLGAGMFSSTLVPTFYSCCRR